MATYVYECQNDNCELSSAEFERLLVNYDDRDDQICGSCDSALKRKIRFTGSVWAPTAGGMR